MERAPEGAKENNDADFGRDAWHDPVLPVAAAAPTERAAPSSGVRATFTVRFTAAAPTAYMMPSEAFQPKLSRPRT